MTNIPYDFGAWLACRLETKELAESDLVSFQGGEPRLNTPKVKKQFRKFANGRGTDHGIIEVGAQRYKVAASLCLYDKNDTQISFEIKKAEVSDSPDLTLADGHTVERVIGGLGDVVCINVLYDSAEGLGVACRPLPKLDGLNWTKRRKTGIAASILGEGRVEVVKASRKRRHTGWRAVFYIDRGCTSFLSCRLEAFDTRLASPRKNQVDH